MAGKVKATHRKYYYNAPYTYVILSELKGDEVGLLLLNPPFTFESKKSWVEMRRH
ncbi:MAG: hypothetical protein N2053_07030 [Chitinispirillaceae bacterium]|nr:hypothetical protein [Chitinispirillaceae bacterium]